MNSIFILSSRGINLKIFYFNFNCEFGLLLLWIPLKYWFVGCWVFWGKNSQECSRRKHSFELFRNHLSYSEIIWELGTSNSFSRSVSKSLANSEAVSKNALSPRKVFHFLFQNHLLMQKLSRSPFHHVKFFSWLSEFWIHLCMQKLKIRERRWPERLDETKIKHTFKLAFDCIQTKTKRNWYS